MTIDPILWKELSAGLRDEMGLIRRRIPMSNGVTLFAALISPSGLPALLIESSLEQNKRPTQVNCMGFSLRSDNKTGGGNCFLLELADVRFHDVFLVLSEDIASKMQSAKDEHQAIRVFMTQISRWRDFFDEHDGDGLSKQEQHGLWGELWALKTVLAPVFGLAESVTAWVGPEGANQDFSFRSIICEVKTSVSPPHERFSVSNVRQLDSATSTPFVLLFLALDIKQNSPESLPQLVSEIRDIIAEDDPAALVLFDTKLIQCGYFRAHEATYTGTGYFVRHQHLFHVCDGFPRIIENALPGGVGDVKYSVAVDSCTDFEIQESQLRVFKEHAGSAQ
jgi:hypothetical protein